MDTIFALSSAQGRAGVAVIRISGSLAHDAIQRLTKRLPAPRRATLRLIYGADQQVIDQAIVLIFNEKQSFTGEEVAEIQCHGSLAVTRALLSTLASFPGLRAAEPGEFTRRALENGCLDLSQVEGLADLIEAETEAQRRQSFRIMTGDLTARVEEWRSALIRAIALLEVTIDFADEDVPETVTPDVRQLTQGVVSQLRRQVEGFSTAERVRNGFEVAIVGAPNVGKSTLLNALAGRDAALTSSVAGTTRDVIEVRMDLRGIPVTLLDTAGLRETDDEVERLGISRARERAQAADLRVFLVSPEEQPSFEPENDDIILISKADLTGLTDNAISGVTGQGLDRLMDRIISVFQDRIASAGLAVRERHRIAMEDAILSIAASQQMLDDDLPDPELVSENLRVAIRSLDSITGRFDIENVLDEIFTSFCLGK